MQPSDGEDARYLLPREWVGMECLRQFRMEEPERGWRQDRPRRIRLPPARRHRRAALSNVVMWVRNPADLANQGYGEGTESVCRGIPSWQQFRGRSRRSQWYTKAARTRHPSRNSYLSNRKPPSPQRPSIRSPKLLATLLLSIITGVLSTLWLSRNGAFSYGRLRVSAILRLNHKQQ